MENYPSSGVLGHHSHQNLNRGDGDFDMINGGRTIPVQPIEKIVLAVNTECLSCDGKCHHLHGERGKVKRISFEDICLRWLDNDLSEEKPMSIRTFHK